MVSIGLLLGVAVITSVLYVPGLGGPLLLDDSEVLIPLIGLPPSLLFDPAQMMSSSGMLGRPISMLSFAANSLAHGDAWVAWKATNLALHLLIGLVLYATLIEVARRTLRDVARVRELALIATVLWLVHPLQVSTVLYTVQRMTELSSLFMLLGLWFYARGRNAIDAGRVGAPAVLFGLLGCTALAALSKENGALLPYLAGALELTVFAGTRRPRWLVLTLLALTVLPAAVGAWLFLRNDAALLARGYRLREFGPFERLLTEPRVVATYLRWILLPRREDYGFYHDDIRVSESLTGDAAASAALALLAALAGAMLWLRRRAPLCAFGMALFFIGLALESSFIGLDLAYEHRTYLPLAGIALIVAVALVRLGRARVRRLAAGGVVGVLLLLTATRAMVWGDPEQLHTAAFVAHPESLRARVMLVEWRLANGDAAGAMALLPDDDVLTFAAERERVACLATGRPTDALGALAKRVAAADRLERFATQVLLYLAEATLDGSCAVPVTTMREMLWAMSKQPVNAPTRYRVRMYAARLAWQSGERDRALAWLAAAVRHQRGDAFAHYLAAEWHAERGDAEAARDALERARATDRSGRYAMLDDGVAELVAAAARKAR